VSSIQIRRYFLSSDPNEFRFLEASIADLGRPHPPTDASVGDTQVNAI
jgi:hypothetical protein